jgi:hypothetical protein
MKKLTVLCSATLQAIFRSCGSFQKIFGICSCSMIGVFAAFGQQDNTLHASLTQGAENSATQQQDAGVSFLKETATVHNLFIITLDGFRWQELFGGMDITLASNEKFTPGSSLLHALYGAPTPDERRKKLMPFFWNVMATNGQVYGNRDFDNKVDVSNAYAKSYPGYNEIFTGYPDPFITSNKKIRNPNYNVLEYLNKRPGFENKVAAFTSWDVFPYIFNEERSGFLINSGYDTLIGPMPSEEQSLINKTEEEGISEKTNTRHDQLTLLVAKEYIRQNKPRVVFLGFGETDEFAHQERYDLYIGQANQIDKMLADLWHWVQTTPGYADNTTFLITTDHGRGRKKMWTSHGQLINGSSETWIAVMGPNIPPLGEVKEQQQLHQYELADIIARLLGERF